MGYIWLTLEKEYSFQHCANKLVIQKKAEKVMSLIILLLFQFGGCLFNKMNNAIGYYGKMLNFDDVEMRDWDPVCEEL